MTTQALKEANKTIALLQDEIKALKLRHNNSIHLKDLIITNFLKEASERFAKNW